jgi:hypothetical protein
MNGSQDSGLLKVNADNGITREEMIAMAARALGVVPPQGGASSATDFGDTADWARDAVASGQPHERVP